MKQRILDVTRGGLDIILSYYPQAQECVDGSAKMFKLRTSEKTASASLKEYKGIWYVTDFGDDSTGRNAFDVAMREECLPFKQTIFLLAQRYGVETTLSSEINKPTIKSRKATKDEPNGTFSFVEKKEPSEADLEVFGPFVKPQTMQKYSYKSLESYSITKEGKTTTITANDNYPIFMRDCGTFQKIYKPLEYNKAFRFFYNGEKPRDYINGLEEVRKAFAKLEAENDEEEDVKARKRKLSEVIICSGERDAMNVAGMGFLPIWLNSETAALSDKDFYDLLRMADKVYNVPDIDDTGLRASAQLALRFLELHTVELPQWLRSYKDNRGKGRKDLRDFLELRPANAEFNKLLNTAKQCKFWNIIVSEKGNRTEIKTTSLLYYLRLNGFYKIKDKVTNQMRYIRVSGYKVEEYEPKRIRDFIKTDLQHRQLDNAILDVFLNSKRTGAALADDLETIELNFEKNSFNSRTFFFENCSITVTADKVTETRNDDIKSYTWINNVSPHRFKRLEPSFEVKVDKQTDNLSFLITSTKSHYFRMLINASRIYWKEEFEHRLSNVVEENEQYRKDFQFATDGPRLKQEEITEQTRHILNKIYAIGYMLHRYKFDSKSLAVWVMENKLTDEDESSGGSGKSFFLKALKKLSLMNIVTLQGRDKKVTENKHLLDRVSADTDLLLVDDAHRYIDFDYFYTMITGDATVNPKGDKSFEIDYQDSPNMAFTSNFPPPNNDRSTMRRMLNVVFSDYYHERGNDGAYLESRSIRDDFGYDLFGNEYTEEFYNEDINFCVDCLQFYLSMIPFNVVLQPPMENVMKRINIAQMGGVFKEWAEVFFSADSDNLDVLLNKSVIFKTFVTETGNNLWKIHKFTKALKAFVENTDYIEELNPRQLQGNDGKRILRKIDGKQTECIYLKTVGAPLNEQFKLDY